MYHLLFGNNMIRTVANKKLDLYKPRQPRKSSYYKLIEAHHEELKSVWEERYQPNYGF